MSITNKLTWEQAARQATRDWKLAAAKKAISRSITNCEFTTQAYQIANDWQKQYPRDKKITRREIDALNKMLPEGFRASKSEEALEMRILIYGGINNRVEWSIYNRHIQVYRDLDQVFLNSINALPYIRESIASYQRELTVIDQAIDDQEKLRAQVNAYESKYSTSLREAIK